MSKKMGVCILGATGSIGDSTLGVLARHKDRFELVAVSAYSNVDKMLSICQEYLPQIVVMVDEDAATKLSKQISSDIKVLSGQSSLDEIVSKNEVDYVMAAIVGAAGLNSTLAAIKADKKVLLANKESLVMSGEIFMSELKQSSAKLIPVDSEHNAIFQCLPDNYEIGTSPAGVSRILLTGSGGPFLDADIDTLATKTPEQAIAHPNWSMGAKISVDSATMMNKALEWVEAKWLFGVADDDLQIVIHPQSIIHSMVEFTDGSVLAQMGQSDMKLPIAHAFGQPARINSGTCGLNFYDLPRLEFRKPDFNKFPCLQLAREAWDKGGTTTTILNAANEVAVQSFLENKIGFMDIIKTIENTLAAMNIEKMQTMQEVMIADQTARKVAQQKIQEIQG